MCDAIAWTSAYACHGIRKENSALVAACNIRMRSLCINTLRLLRSPHPLPQRRRAAPPICRRRLVACYLQRTILAASASTAQQAGAAAAPTHAPQPRSPRARGHTARSTRARLTRTTHAPFARRSRAVRTSCTIHSAGTEGESATRRRATRTARHPVRGGSTRRTSAPHTQCTWSYSAWMNVRTSSLCTSITDESKLSWRNRNWRISFAASLNAVPIALRSTSR